MLLLETRTRRAANISGMLNGVMFYTLTSMSCYHIGVSSFILG